MSTYIDEIHATHAAIEQWLSQGTGSLADIMAKFSSDFTMITASGSLLNYFTLEDFFRQLKGTRPGLIIQINHITQCQQWQNAALIRYQEQQNHPQSTTIRWSTALFSLQNNRPVWQYLQETRCQH